MSFYKIHTPVAGVVLIEFEGTPTDEGVSVYLDELLAQVRQPTPKAYLADLTRAATNTATHRKMQADWFVQYNAILRERMLGMALVMTSSMHRGIIAAVNWVAPPPFPFKACKTRAEGHVICTNWLLEHSRKPRQQATL